MTNEEKEAVSVLIMLSSTISDIEGKTPKVSKLESTINKGLINRFKTGKMIDTIGRFGLPTSKHELSPEYFAIEDVVREKWDTTRREVIPKDDKWMVSMSELVLQFINLLNQNEHQHSIVSEKIVTSAANSFMSHPSGKKTEIQDIQHARTLVNAFRDNMGMKKDNRLSRLRYTIEQNLIVSKGYK